MESWGYPSEGKGHFFPDEIDLPMDVLLRSTKALFELDDEDFCDSERDGVLSPGEAVESFNFFEMGSPVYFQSSFQNNQCLEASSYDLDCDFSKLLDTACDNTSRNSSAGPAESPLEHSISFVKSKSPDSSLIDLELGMLDDFTDVQYSKPAEVGSNVSLACQTTLGKKDQTAMVCYLAPICQVYGCNIDLSPLKDYHKRHKVCDVHSKAAKVVFNGIEQRFCQQCSRFHRLAEFDGNKRSCRRRLAGHNERRRKSEFDNFSGRPRSKYPGISLLRKSRCAFGNILPGGFFYPGKRKQLHQSEGCKKPLKESMYIPKKFDLLSRSSLNGNGKRLSSEIGSSARQNYNTYGSASAIQGNSSAALSLLSLQSQVLSNHTAGNSIASTLTSQDISANPNDLQHSHNPFRDSSTEDFIVSDSFFHGLNSSKVDQIGTMMLYDGGHAVDLEVCKNDFHQSNLSNVNISPARGCTVNLLQLSTHLHRVEQQRQFILGKQGKTTFVASPAFNWDSIQ